jgi:hypothetical protein
VLVLPRWAETADDPSVRLILDPNRELSAAVDFLCGTDAIGVMGFGLKRNLDPG